MLRGRRDLAHSQMLPQTTRESHVPYGWVVWQFSCLELPAMMAFSCQPSCLYCLSHICDSFIMHYSDYTTTCVFVVDREQDEMLGLLPCLP